MRILMLGRGTIATIYGQAFENAGHDVTFAVRPSRMAEYSAAVLVDLTDARRSPFGRRTRTSFTPRLRATSDPGSGYDIIVLSVGHHRLRDAAAAIAPHVGDATVLVFGNVWDEPDAAVAPIPVDHVVFGFPGAGGGFDGDGVLHGALFRSVTLGTGEFAPTWRKRVVRDVFKRSGFAVKVEGDMRGWLWLHVVSDAGMFYQALRSGGLANMVGDRGAFREALRTTQELLPVLEARGVDLQRRRSGTLPARRPATIGTVMAWATRLLPIARVSLAAHTDPHAAEPRAVLADVLSTAHQLGIPAPRLAQAAESTR